MTRWLINVREAYRFENNEATGDRIAKLLKEVASKS